MNPTWPEALTVPLTFVRLTRCVEDAVRIPCLNCTHALEIHQPEVGEPERFIGTCEQCGRWYLMDCTEAQEANLMILLPDRSEFD